MTSTYILRKGQSRLADLANGSQALFPYGVGNQYYLDPTNGADGNSGLSPAQAFKTLAVAYAALTDGHNDVLFYIPGSSSISLSAAFDWAKSYTHFVGLSAPTRVAQRARIFQASGDLNLSPFFTISGSGCVFENLYIFQGTDDAQSLIDVSVTGSRNYFYNVHFAGGGHATNAIDGCASLHINGGSENTFDRCTIGLDTIGLGTGGAGLVFAATTEASRNIFKDCHFTMWSSHNAAIFVEVLNGAGIGRYTIFDGCVFVNTGTSLLASVAIPAGIDVTNKKFFFKDCVSYGSAKWDANDRGLLLGNMNAVTGADLSGVMVQIIS